MATALAQTHSSVLACTCSAKREAAPFSIGLEAFPSTIARSSHGAVEAALKATLRRLLRQRGGSEQSGLGVYHRQRRHACHHRCETPLVLQALAKTRRSEERRVGKEGRSRWS